MAAGVEVNQILAGASYWSGVPGVVADVRVQRRPPRESDGRAAPLHIIPLCPFLLDLAAVSS